LSKGKQRNKWRQQQQKSLTFEASLGKILANPYPQNKPGIITHAYNLSYVADWDRRIWVQDCLRQKHGILSEK
jgi:hypothetical protein